MCNFNKTCFDQSSDKCENPPVFTLQTRRALNVNWWINNNTFRGVQYAWSAINIVIVVLTMCDLTLSSIAKSKQDTPTECTLTLRDEV